MDGHHKNLVHDLREHQRAAGGPVSLTQFLRLARRTLGPLRDNRVAWEWITARVLAVHQTMPGEDIPEDIPAARRRSARLISSLWARVIIVPDTEHIQASSHGDETSDPATHGSTENDHPANQNHSGVTFGRDEPLGAQTKHTPSAAITKPEPQGTDPPSQSSDVPTEYSRPGATVLITGGAMIDQMNKLKEISRA